MNLAGLLSWFWGRALGALWVSGGLLPARFHPVSFPCNVILTSERIPSSRELAQRGQRSELKPRRLKRLFVSNVLVMFQAV